MQIQICSFTSNDVLYQRAWECMVALRIQANIGLFFLTISVDGLMSEMLLGAAALFVMLCFPYLQHAVSMELAAT